MDYKFNALAFTQYDTKLYMGFGKPSDIRSVSDIDIINPKLAYDDKDQGYQRKVLEARKRKIARYRKLAAKDGNLFPVPLILAARGGKIQYKNGMITVSDENKLYIVDGANRLEGTMLGIESMPEIDDVMLPFVVFCDEAGDRNLELQMFKDINSTAVKVPTDHVTAILASKWADSPVDDIPQALKPKVIITRTITKLSKKRGGCWFNMINIVPDMRSTGLVVKKGKAGSFIQSLSPLYRKLMQNEKFRTTYKTQEEQSVFLCNMLFNYWKVIESKNAKAFADFGNYCIMKSQGIKGFHGLLLDAMTNNDTLNISEDYFTTFLKGYPVTGKPEFWVKDGEAWNTSASHNSEMVIQGLKGSIKKTSLKSKP